MLVSVTPGILEAGYTSVGYARRKNGYGKKPVDAVADYARRNDLKVIAKCGFIAMIFDKYPGTLWRHSCTSLMEAILGLPQEAHKEQGKERHHIGPVA